MQPRGLIDTGALLALLDRDDKWHSACVAAFGGMRLPLGTTYAVLAELFHLLGESKKEHDAAWQLLRSGGITILALEDADLPALQLLMDRYRDRPMDFADATLVHVATKHTVADILTIDHDDFETYRWSGKRRFRIVPGRSVPGA
jgi:predicted nucleic acid-binding protein